MIIDDCLKKIAIIVVECFFHSTHSYSSKHLCENVTNSFKEIIAQNFLGYIYDKIESAFDKALKDIKELNKDAAKYISNLSLKK